MAGVIDRIKVIRFDPRPLPGWAEGLVIGLSMLLIAGILVAGYQLQAASPAELEDLADRATGKEIAGVLLGLLACFALLIDVCVICLLKPQKVPGSQGSAGRLARAEDRQIKREVAWMLSDKRKAWEREREDWKMEQTAKIYRQVMDQHERGILRPDFGDEPGRDDLAS